MRDATDVTLVLDRSSSMQAVQQETIDGFNLFLKSQQDLNTDIILTMVQFNTDYEFIYNGVPIKEAKPLTKDTFIPRGYTALYDAVGKAINQAGERLKAVDESIRPDKVVFAILTDGEENSSKIFNHDQMANMIKQQTDFYKWNFMFLGSNQDAMKTARSMNISPNLALDYASNAEGTKAIYRAMSVNMSLYSQTGDAKSLKFTDEQRKEQVDADKKINVWSKKDKTSV